MIEDRERTEEEIDDIIDSFRIIMKEKLEDAIIRTIDKNDSFDVLNSRFFESWEELLVQDCRDVIEGFQ